MSDNMGLSKLLDMQRQLMEKVPHAVRPDVLLKMGAARNIIDTLLLYLSSCGHKPWRPNPLPEELQDDRLELFLKQVNRLKAFHEQPQETRLLVDTRSTRTLVSALGVIEETIEYLNTLVKVKPDRLDQLEEITDMLFFYLEMVAMSGFSWEQVEAEYVRKHAVNLKRYEDAKKGDYGWDDRAEKEEL